MFKILKPSWTLFAVALVFIATSAYATPQTYLFTSGNVVIRAINTNTNASVLSGPTSVNVPLGGTFVVFDPATGTNGTILDLQFVPLGDFTLVLDPIEAALREITVSNAMLINAPGSPDDATADVVGNAFNLDTEMSADVSGFFPDISVPDDNPYPSTYYSSQTSTLGGSIFVNGNTLQLGILGVNIARFGTALDPYSEDIQVKADFFFTSTLVPEPGTALLMGLGLVGLAGARPNRNS